MICVLMNFGWSTFYEIRILIFILPTPSAHHFYFLHFNQLISMQMLEDI